MTTLKDVVLSEAAGQERPHTMGPVLMKHAERGQSRPAAVRPEGWEVG